MTQNNARPRIGEILPCWKLFRTRYSGWRKNGYTRKDFTKLQGPLLHMRDFAYGMKNNILKEKFEESLKYLKRLPDLQDDYWNAYNSSFLQMDSELYRQPEDAIVECHANFESLMQEIEQTLINSSARRQENP